MDGRGIPVVGKKNWKSSGGNGRGTDTMETSTATTRRGHDQPPLVHAFYDAIYMHNVTVASTWEHGYVAIHLAVSFLSSGCPVRTVLTSPLRPALPRGGGERSSGAR